MILPEGQSFTDGDTILDVGFDKSGGFYVINHVRRRAAYAYASSPHATAAKTRPGWVVAQMVQEFDVTCPEGMQERHYEHICGL